jgi:repressor LexA
MATRRPIMPRPLTRRQSEVVSFVRRYVEKRGFPPTIRELADELGVHPNAVAGHLSAAERKGVLKRAARVARGLTLTTGGRDHAEAK